MNITLSQIEFHLFELPLLAVLVVSFCTIAISRGMGVTLRDSKPLLRFLTGFFLFLIAIIASALFASKPGMIIKAFLKWTEVLVLALLVFLYIRNLQTFKTIYWVLFISMFGYSIISLYWLISGRLVEYGFRLPGGYDSLFALSMVIPFIKKKSGKFILIGLLVIAVIFFSFSRGAWLGLALLLAYMTKYFYGRNKKKTIISIVLILVAILAIKSESIIELVDWRLSTSFDSGNASNIERSGLIRVAFNAFLSSPIFGIGALNYSTYLVNTSDLYIMRAEILETMTPHNFFLEILSELGLFGFCALLLLLYSIYSALVFPRSQSHPTVGTLYQEGLFLLYFTFLFAISLGFISGGYRFYMALLFGMALSLIRAGENG
ncbi:MAG TPA: O-antigen ligase family protein [bacterium]|nr:O-antigen ligase family protein [bacterium]